MSTFKAKSKRQQRRLINAKVEKVICELRAENFTSEACSEVSHCPQPLVQICTNNDTNYSTPSTSSGFVFNENLVVNDSNSDGLNNISPEIFENYQITLSQGPNSNFDISQYQILNFPSNIPVEQIDFQNEETPQQTSKDFLKEWALKHNVTHTAINDLLYWFSTNPNILNLPKDARTLLSTPRQLDIQNMGNGHYYYFGFVSGITKIYKKYGPANAYYLDFNVDGIPIHKSTKEQFWPILCKVSNFPQEHPFVVAIFSGSTKPPLEHYFTHFLKDLKYYTDHGIIISDKILRIICRCFCCDTPARTFIKGTKGHNAYYGCDKCTTSGEYYCGKVVFPEVNAECRSNAKFLNGDYGDYHKQRSPLVELGVDFISSFPIDYMHNICLGVVKKLIDIWKNGNRHLYRFKLDKLELFERRIEIISTGHYWPSEMDRKPRPIAVVEHWKAIEFRHFLLYVSSLLIDILPNYIFYNFMLLRFGITILLSPTLNNKYNAYAAELLKQFVLSATDIYGKEFCVYNVHSVIHLAEQAKTYDTLNSINCFSYENYLGSLKRLLRKSNQSLQQVVNRILEGKDLIAKDTFEGKKLLGKPIAFKDNRAYYKKLQINNEIISIKTGDNCVFLSNNDIFIVKEIYVHSDEILIEGSKFNDVKSFIKYPTDSSFIQLYQVSNQSEEILTVSSENISKKAILMPLQNGTFVCSPYLHLM